MHERVKGVFPGSEYERVKGVFSGSGHERVRVFPGLGYEWLIKTVLQL